MDLLEGILLSEINQINKRQVMFDFTRGIIFKSIYINNSQVKVLLKVAAVAAKSLQSCPILCDPVDGSPPGSPVPGILQARILEWVAISFSNA